jgi:hypothetical protein
MLPGLFVHWFRRARRMSLRSRRIPGRLRFRPRLVLLEARLVPAINIKPIPDVATVEHLQVILKVGITPDEKQSGNFLFALDPAHTQPGATITPTGNTSALFQWTPSEDQPTSFLFQLDVTDTTVGNTESSSFHVQVIEDPDPPVLNPIANQTVVQGARVFAQAVAQDDDTPPNPATYSLTSAPPGATINPTTGLFQWNTAPNQLPGVYAVTVRATLFAGEFDSDGFSIARFAETTFFITVTAAQADTSVLRYLAGNPIIGVTDPPRDNSIFTPNLANSVVMANFQPNPITPPLPLASGRMAVLDQITPVNPGAPADLQLTMEPVLQKPLRLNNTEGNGDGSSVERLYQDFLGPMSSETNPASTDKDPLKSTDTQSKKDNTTETTPADSAQPAPMLDTPNESDK